MQPWAYGMPLCGISSHEGVTDSCGYNHSRSNKKMCVRFTIEISRGEVFDLDQIRKLSGLDISSEGRGVHLLCPKGDCGCGFVKNFAEIKCDFWDLHGEAQTALTHAMKAVYAKKRIFRFTSHYYGEPVNTELAIGFEAFLEVLGRNELRNSTAYVVKC